MSNAVVVGSGPNGLAAAVELAAAGIEVTVLEAKDVVGGGARSSESIVAGLMQDECSAVHPMGPTSAFARRHCLTDYGLEWLTAPIDMVHPLDDGTAGVLHRSVQDTAADLGADGTRWRRLFGWSSEHFGALSEDIFQPLIRIPRHPIGMARFGIPTLVPAATLGRYFRTPAARALFGGVAAHAFQPLSRPLSSAIGLGIITAGHHSGWVVARGGTQAITDAMVARLTELGGRIETGVRIECADQLPPADITMFDLTPEAVAGIMGDRLPARIARAYRRFRHSPGAFKVDFAVEGGVPWANPDAHRAGTVHLGGNFAETLASEREIAAGRMPDRPFVLVSQQYLADPSRSAGDIHPVYSYAHVPHGYSGDSTEAIIAQFERFAPDFRERVIGMAVRSTTQMSVYNANYVGGDIITGAKDIRQLVFGPRITTSPYTTGVPGTYICSAATPPGPGAHGMCGYNAARLAISRLDQRQLRRKRTRNSSDVGDAAHQK